MIVPCDIMLVHILKFCLIMHRTNMSVFLKLCSVNRFEFLKTEVYWNFVVPNFLLTDIIQESVRLIIVSPTSGRI